MCNSQVSNLLLCSHYSPLQLVLQFFFRALGHKAHTSQVHIIHSSHVLKCQALVLQFIVSLSSCLHHRDLSPRHTFLPKVQPFFLSSSSTILCEFILPGHLGEPCCWSHWSCSGAVCPSSTLSVAEAMASSYWAGLLVPGCISS